MIPPYNLKGVFELSEPFNSLIDSRAIYKVVGINNIPELELEGKSPYDTIYKPLGLEESVIINDINNQVPIVTLRGEGNKHIYIPANRIVSMPKVDGYIYKEKVITVPLGTVPDTLDLTILCSDIQSYVKDRIGIEAPVKSIDTSASILLTPEENHRYESNRKGKIILDKSYRTRYLETVELLEKCKKIKSELEEYIVKNKI